MQKVYNFFFKDTAVSTKCIHFTALAIFIWYFFPNLFTTRDIPRRPFLPNLTLEGVDSNKNGIRDEVEIELSKKILDDKVLVATMRYAAGEWRGDRQSIGYIYSSEDTRVCNKLNIKALNEYDIDPYEIDNLIYNNKARIGYVSKNTYTVFKPWTEDDPYCI